MASSYHTRQQEAIHLLNSQKKMVFFQQCSGLKQVGQGQGDNFP